MPLPAEQESGDLFVVEPRSEGVLVAVIDGVGHGPAAAAAARTAASVLRAHAGDSLVSLVLRCHEALKGSRGVAMTIALLGLRDRTVTWLAVGNVEGVLFQGEGGTPERPERALLRGGVVGYRLPPRLRAEVVSLKPLDTLIMATDGIRPDFADGTAFDGDPERIAAGIVARSSSGADDALVVVARYLGDDVP
jgi:serine phosphatase RsbU (regulator of sigma subunit)